MNATIKLSSLAPLYKECEEIMVIDHLYYTGIDKIDAYKTTSYETMERIKEFQDPGEIEQYFRSIFDTRFTDFFGRACYWYIIDHTQ